MIFPGHLVSTMPRAGRWQGRLVDWPVLLAVALPVLIFIVEGDISLSLLDEGFLWYGAQRVLSGEVPLLDFQSYDIGRYYWSAGWMLLTGSTGILPVRAGNAVLGACAAVIATRLVRSGPNRSAADAALAALTFSLLMVPSEKVADSFAALLLTGGLARLLQRPLAGRRWAAFGACLGLASAIGINHALYGVIGLLLAGIYLAGVRRQRPTLARLRPLAIGAAIGYSPVLLCHLLVPGFAAAFADTIRQLFEAGTTNLALPMPRLGSLLDIVDSAEARREAALAVLFCAALAFIVVCSLRLSRRDRGVVAATPPVGSDANATFAAAVVVAIPYVHYTVSRADFVHVVVSVLPLLIAAWTYPWRRRAMAARLAAPALALVCCGYLVTKHPGFLLLGDEPLEQTTVQGESLRLPPEIAAEMRLLYRLTGEHAAAGRAIYAAPYWPGAYAATGRRSPTWEIYALFPAAEWRQRREIQRLAAADVALALVLGWQMDRRPDLGFERTHPLIAGYVRRCFREREVAANPLPRLRAYVADRSRCAAP